MPRYNEEKLGEILSALPPAPESWVKAAQDIPLAQRGSTRSSSVPMPTTTTAVA